MRDGRQTQMSFQQRAKKTGLEAFCLVFASSSGVYTLRAIWSGGALKGKVIHPAPWPAQQDICNQSIFPGTPKLEFSRQGEAIIEIMASMYVV